jgi:hypothetical protein
MKYYRCMGPPSIREAARSEALWALYTAGAPTPKETPASCCASCAREPGEYDTRNVCSRCGLTPLFNCFGDPT